MLYSDVQRIYESKTHKSKMLYRRAMKVFAGGVNHNIRFFEPYPFFATSAKGKYLYDVDGNKYVDYWMGHWALILGHSPNVVVEKLDSQIRHGTLYGTVNDTSIKLGESIKKAIPTSELLRF